MTDNVVTLSCPRCRKTFRTKAYASGKKYACPTCKGPIAPEPPGGTPAEDELTLRDEPRVPREIPVRFGKYIIDGEVGRGGMGVIYKGRQEGLDRVVAIKMLLGGLSGNAEILQRFQRESRAAARLRHPNIVSVHEVGEFNGQPFFTMDFIQGKGLDGVLRDRPVGAEEGARILRDVARAIHFAHQHGVIHRDLKPGNILIDPDGKPMVTDFGLAKDLDSKSMLSVSGEIMGTPAFMSPEQAEGRVGEVDRQSDVYSLGAVLYRILTGRPPFEGPTLVATIYKVVHEYTTDPAKLNPRVPAELSAICMKALEKEKPRRYSTAAEFADDLDRFLKGEAVSARPLSPAERLRRQVRRQKRVFQAAGSVAVVAIAAIISILLFVGSSELDVIEAGLANPDMRLTALRSLIAKLDQFKDKSRAIALARKAVAESKDEASREAAYEKPHASLAASYVPHLAIAEPERLRHRLINVLAALKCVEAVPAMLEIVRHTRGPIREEAVKFFVAVPDISAFYDMGLLVTDKECGPWARMAIQRMYIDRVLLFINPGAARVGPTLTEFGEEIQKYNEQLENALKEFKIKGTVDPMADTLAALKSAIREERMQAAYELGESQDPRAKEILFATLKDADDGVARMAAAGLSQQGPADYKDRIAPLLKDGRPGVRRNAAFLLGKCGDKSLRSAIEAAHRNETDPDSKYAMEDALVLLR